MTGQKMIELDPISGQVITKESKSALQSGHASKDEAAAMADFEEYMDIGEVSL